MFPKDAGFICRSCITWFTVKHENFASIARAGKLTCPGCGQEASGRTVRDFFKTYFKFAGMLDKLAEDGFTIKEIYAKEAVDMPESGLTKFSIEGMQTICTKCGQIYGGGIDKKSADRLGLIQCSDCGKKPRHIVFTEFFKTLDHINTLQQDLADHFQLDLFSCRDIDPQTLLGGGTGIQSDRQ